METQVTEEVKASRARWLSETENRHDTAVLADAYCDEHPDGDELPVGLGIVADIGDRRIEVRISGVLQRSAYLVVRLCEVDTIGDVRRLVESLKMKA